MLKRVLWIAGVWLLTFGLSGQARSADNCESLGSLDLRDTTITLAESVSAPAEFPLGWRDLKLTVSKNFCRVAATIKPTEVSNIRIEVWLPVPDDWNGKYLGTGNGGSAGTIRYELLHTGLEKGYATANTDLGSKSSRPDFDFAIGEPELMIDFSYRATHLMTLVAKEIIQRYYGKTQEYSYFTGCSTGGHQGLSEVQRFPSDYDGVVSGAPAHNRTRLHSVGLWNYRVTHSDRRSYFSPEKVPMIHREVIAACDGLDGIIDGIIDDPRRCQFRTSSLLCKGAETNECLTKPQIVALDKIYDGMRNPHTGDHYFPGIPHGSETSQSGLLSAINRPLPIEGEIPEYSGGLLAWAKGWNGSFDFDKDLARVENEIGSIANALDSDLSDFRNQGGKIILYAGWSDSLVPALDTINYYDAVTDKMGGIDATRQFARLFVAPGLGHCRGGAGPNVFDTLNALDNWVKNGEAPERIIAVKFNNDDPSDGVKMTRPICPYPRVARWTGTGTVNRASNFHCVDPG